MTVLEALKETRDNLAKIPLRISDFNEVGVPIHTAVQNLGAVIDALERNAQENQAEQNPTQEAENGKATDDQQQDV